MRALSRLVVIATFFVILVGWTTASEPRPLSRIAFGSCADQDKPQPIWAAVLASRPEAFLFLGDNIYGDSDNLEVLKAKYDKCAAIPGVKQLFASVPTILGTWDDHDYGKNDAGAEFAIKNGSQQLLLDFFRVPADSPRRQQKGVYHAQTFGPAGKRVQILMLDTRYFRSPLKIGEPIEGVRSPYVPNTDPDATILGSEQWKWLEEQLRQPAELRLLVSSIQVVAEDHPFEKWTNFPAERERLYKLLKDTKANGVVILSGDRHFAELSVMDAGLGYPLMDLTASGLNKASKSYRSPDKNKHRISAMPYGDHFGFVQVDWQAEGGPRVSLQIRDIEGDVTIQQKFPLSLLGPPASVSAVPVPEGVIDASQARTHTGKRMTVQMTVRSTGRGGALTFLNSMANHRDESNFTVVIRKESLDKFKKAGIDDPASFYGDKTIRVTGNVQIFQGKVQINVDEPSQIELAK